MAAHEKAKLSDNRFCVLKSQTKNFFYRIYFYTREQTLGDTDGTNIRGVRELYAGLTKSAGFRVGRRYGYI